MARACQKSIVASDALRSGASKDTWRMDPRGQGCRRHGASDFRACKQNARRPEADRFTLAEAHELLSATTTRQLRERHEAGLSDNVGTQAQKG